MREKERKEESFSIINLHYLPVPRISISLSDGQNGSLIVFDYLDYVVYYDIILSSLVHDPRFNNI